MDEKDMQEVALKYARSIAGIAFSYLKNTHDAEDIMQEVYLALLKSPPHAENEENLKAWLFRVTVNKCKDHLKSSWIRKKTYITEDLTYLPPEHAGVIEAVLSLPEKYRQPVYFHYCLGYSLKEISMILGIKGSTVGTRLHRGKDMLRKLLEGE